MKLALIGYGKMGQEVGKIAEERGHTLHLLIDNETDWNEKGSLLSECDAAIEFTMPEAAVSNILRCLETGTAVVAGTTGWFSRLEEVREACTSRNGTLFFAPNFSLGVNIFFELNRKLASLMASFREYRVSMEEVHHTRKLDAPSGTAIVLAGDIMKLHPELKEWVNTEASGPEQLGIISRREGMVAGIHEIDWHSDVDRITIRHEAFNRRGLALGAILAAEFVNGKKGIYTMADLLNI